MEFNIVQKSVFGKHGALDRLDAEFVAPSLLESEHALRELQGDELPNIGQPYRGPTLNEAFAPADSLHRYVSIDDVDTADGLTYSVPLRYEDRPSRAKYETAAGDLLISNVRPNRNAVALVTERLGGALASSGFTLVRSGREKFPVEYLFVFMKTPHFVGQMLRRNRGSMYPAVLGADVFSTWIPTPSDVLRKVVVNGVRTCLARQDKFFALLAEGESRLERFLAGIGAPPSPLDTRRSGADWTPVSSGSFFATNSPRRLDAEFFRREYKEFEARARAWARVFRLGESYSLRSGAGNKPGNDGVAIVKQGMLTNAGVNWSAVSVELGKLPAQGEVQNGDILIACTAHEVYYVGRRVDYVREVPRRLAANRAVGDVMVCRSRHETPIVPGSYLAAFLRSPAGLHQVQRCIRGLRGGHVYRQDLEAYVYVPVPPENWLRGFEELMLDAESARNDSRTQMVRQIDIVEKWLADAGIRAPHFTQEGGG